MWIINQNVYTKYIEKQVRYDLYGVFLSLLHSEWVLAEKGRILKSYK